MIINDKGLEMIKRLLDAALDLFDAENSTQNDPDDETAVRLVVKAREMLDYETCADEQSASVGGVAR